MKDRVAIVTGASRGIGRGIALALASRGATVVAAARSESALEALAGEAKEKELAGSIDPRVLDVSSREAVDSFVEQVEAAHEKIAILVNNAGITRDGLLMTMEDADFEDVLTTNLRSAFWLTRRVAKNMVSNRYGRIVNITSVAGIMGNPGQANYAASKAGMIGLTKSVAKELGRRKITCNAVAPGFITTDMTSDLPEQLVKGAKELIPLRRFGDVSEVAEVVAFLAGETASYITGQVVVVDGGLHM